MTTDQKPIKPEHNINKGLHTTLNDINMNCFYKHLNATNVT